MGASLYLHLLLPAEDMVTVFLLGRYACGVVEYEYGWVAKARDGI